MRLKFMKIYKPKTTLCRRGRMNTEPHPSFATLLFPESVILTFFFKFF